MGIPVQPLRGLLLALACLLLANVARAQADPFAALSRGGFERERRAIEALSVSGDPRAAAVIGALQRGDLLAGAGGVLVIRDAGGFVDARSGAPERAGFDASELRPVRMNNAVRGAAETAMGSLSLFSPDPQVRRRAAETVFEARDAAALPALDRALRLDQPPAVRARMLQARAAALLASGGGADADRLAAIGVMRARGDLAARALLASLPPEKPAVAPSLASALSAIDTDLRIWGIAQDVFYGVSLGSVLLLAASGLAITFGVMGVINMAHGEVVMLGAYTTFVVQQAVGSVWPGLAGSAVVLAVPLAFLVSAAAGIAIERGVIRFLYGRPLETLLATWGVSLILQQGVRSLFGASNRPVITPDWMSGAVQWGGLTLTINRLVIIGFSIAVLAALMAVLRFTPLGLQMRAVTQNRRMAASMGIRTPRIDALTFGLGSGVAGMAGVALSQIDNVSPNLGQGYIIDSFLVVVFGGVGNLWGTLVSALSLGVLQKFIEPLAGAVLGKIVLLVVVIAFIQRKPRGLFPLRGRAVEA